MESVKVYQHKKQNINLVTLQNSILTYVYIPDPYIDGDYYKICPKLVQKYGSKEATKLITKISMCFIPRFSHEVLYFTKED